MAGEPEKHVVEGRAAQPEVIQHDSSLVKGANKGGELAHPTVGGRGQAFRPLANGGVSAVSGISGIGGAVAGDDVPGPVEVRRVVDDDLDPFAADLRLELSGRAASDDLTGVDDGDDVCERVGFLQILRRQQQRRSFTDEIADDVPHRNPTAWIETGGRFVQEQQPWVADESRGEIKAAAHPTGVGFDDAVRRAGQRELFEQLAGAEVRGAARQLVKPAEHPQVLGGGEVLVDGGILPGQTDEPAQLLRVAHHVVTEYGRPTAVGPQQGGQDADGRGLAGTVGAEQTEDRALRDLQIETVERMYRAGTGREHLGEGLRTDS